VWNKEEKILKNTCKHKFRNRSDVSHWIFRYWQLVSGNFIPSKIQGKLMAISKDKESIINSIHKQSYKIICINDEDLLEDYDIIKKDLLSAFDKLLPDKCSYELIE